MSYTKVLEMLKGNIAYLSTQIKPWIDKYDCKNAFDLFSKPFEGSEGDKLIIHGYIHRRDAYIQILNAIEAEGEFDGSDFKKPEPDPWDGRPCDVA